MGAAQEFDTEGGVRAGRLGKDLPLRSSGGAVFWGGYVGDIGTNVAEVRWSAFGFPTTGNKVKGKSAEGKVVAEGGGEKGTSVSGGTATTDLLG